MKITDVKLQELHQDYAKKATGQLNKNDVIQSIFNKIANVYWDDNFRGSGPLEGLLERYRRASGQYGDTDEINAVMPGERYDFKFDEEWHKNIYLPQVNSEWVGITYEDKYPISIMETHMERAVNDASQFGTMIGMFLNSVQKKKTLTWYQRLQEWLPKNCINIEVDTKGGEDIQAVGEKITEIVKAFQLPMTKYNQLGMPTLYVPNDINITMNYLSQNILMWDTAKIFHQGNIDRISEILNRSVSIEFADPNLYAIVDVSSSLYIGQVGPSLNLYQQFAENKYTSFFLHETWKVGTIPFHNRVAIWEKGKGPNPDPGPDPTPDEKVDIVVDKKELSIKVEDTGTINITNIDKLKNVKVSSKDAKIATVSIAKGVISVVGVAEGSTTIGVHADNSKADVEIKITIAKKANRVNSK